MASTHGTSPQFDKAPVVENILGVQFARLGLTSGHFGWFWREYLGNDWPTAVDALPVPDQSERFGDQVSWIPAGFQLAAAEPAVRLQMTSTASDRVIQVQNTRFLYNWRKQHGQPYPRYPTRRSDFSALFGKFRTFVGDAGLGEVKPNQWEVSYIDHIPKGELWQSPADWHKILPGLLRTGQLFSGLGFEGVGEWHFEIQPQKGRLHIAMTHGRTGPPEAQEVLVIQWTARGPLQDKPGWDLDSGFNLGHDIIIRAFLEITSPEAQAAWGRRP